MKSEELADALAQWAEDRRDPDNLSVSDEGLTELLDLAAARLRAQDETETEQAPQTGTGSAAGGIPSEEYTRGQYEYWKAALGAQDGERMEGWAANSQKPGAAYAGMWDFAVDAGTFKPGPNSRRATLIPWSQSSERRARDPVSGAVGVCPRKLLRTRCGAFMGQLLVCPGCGCTDPYTKVPPAAPEPRGECEPGCMRYKPHVGRCGYYSGAFWMHLGDEPDVEHVQERCDTTLTLRHPQGRCTCGDVSDGMGPCDTWGLGRNGRCVYCDHKESCHRSVGAVVVESAELMGYVDTFRDHFVKSLPTDPGMASRYVDVYADPPATDESQKDERS